MTRSISPLVFCLASALLGAPSAASDVVFTKQARFRIPYHSEPAEMQRLGAKEIQLYVSTDRGLSWKLAQSVPPTAGRFAYEGPGDGEYWFAVRTLDGLGRLHPQTGDITPGLKVTVDSQPPSLVLSLERIGEQVRLSWRASDTNLDPASLRLEVQQAARNDWTPIAVGGQAAGQTTWTPPAAGAITVRGTIADGAGNSGTADATLAADGRAGYAPLPKNPNLEGPIADQPVPGEVVPFHMASARSETLIRGELGEPGPAPTTVSQRTPVEAMPPRDVQQIAQAPASQQAPPTAAVPATAAAAPATTTPPTAASATSTSPPEGPTRKVINTRAFNLGYEVDEVGPSGVGAVEFFITEDGGQKWFRYGSDDDLQSPYRIDVPNEGTYGFMVRARSGVGLAADPPRAGERPAVLVVVDQSPPVATIQAPTPSTGDASTIPIRWTIQDANPLKEKSIDLAYGPSREGPWTPIATGIDDTGSYDWHVSSIPAAQLFLQLTARDAAGNSGLAVSSEAVTLDLIRPKARITDIDVQPIE